MVRNVSINSHKKIHRHLPIESQNVALHVLFLVKSLIDIVPQLQML